MKVFSRRSCTLPKDNFKFLNITENLIYLKSDLLSTHVTFLGREFGVNFTPFPLDEGCIF